MSKTRIWQKEQNTCMRRVMICCKEQKMQNKTFKVLQPSIVYISKYPCYPGSAKAQTLILVCSSIDTADYLTQLKKRLEAAKKKKKSLEEDLLDRQDQLNNIKRGSRDIKSFFTTSSLYMSPSLEFISPFTFVSFIQMTLVVWLMTPRRRQLQPIKQPATLWTDCKPSKRRLTRSAWILWIPIWTISWIMWTSLVRFWTYINIFLFTSWDILYIYIFTLFFLSLHLFLCLQWTTCGKTSHPWMLRWQRWRTWPHSSPPSAT